MSKVEYDIAIKITASVNYRAPAISIPEKSAREMRDIRIARIAHSLQDKFKEMIASRLEQEICGDSGRSHG